MKMRKFFGFLLIIAFVFACSSDDNGGTTQEEEELSFERGPMLVNWADNIIVPAYNDFSQKLANLEQAINTFNSDPSQTNLEALRASWLVAITTWQRVDMFEIGPAETANFRTNINVYPSDTDQINTNITNGTYDFNLPSNIDAKGFGALDYLLYGSADTDADILALFQNAEGANHRQYLTDIIADMIALTNTVKNEWENSFRDSFVANDGSSPDASTDRYVNDYIFYYEKFLRAGKMGIPAGVFSGTVDPTKLEAYHNGEVSKQLFLEGLDAVQDFFNGKSYNGNSTGESLNSYLNALDVNKDDTPLSQVINDQYNSARQAVSSIGNFREELSNSNPQNFLNAYSEVQLAVALLKVDMTSAMSIAIDFVDADGD